MWCWLASSVGSHGHKFRLSCLYILVSVTRKNVRSWYWYKHDPAPHTHTTKYWVFRVCLVLSFASIFTLVCTSFVFYYYYYVAFRKKNHRKKNRRNNEELTKKPCYWNVTRNKFWSSHAVCSMLVTGLNENRLFGANDSIELGRIIQLWKSSKF